MVTNEKISSTDNLGQLSSNTFFGNVGLEPEIIKEPDLTCPQNDKEWCIEEKESDLRLNEEDYIIVNLMDNIESFTAYEGASIWGAIYRENCFLPSLPSGEEVPFDLDTRD